MKKLFFSLIILVIAIGLGIVIARNQTYVLIGWNQWQIEMTVWVAVFLLMVSFLLFYFLIRIFLGSLRLPRAMRGYWKHKRELRLQNYISQADAAMLVGDYKNAAKKYKKAAKISAEPQLYFLKAAQATINFQPSETQPLLNQAVEYGDNLVTAIIRAELEIHQQKYAEAIITIEQAREKAPLQPKLLRLSYQAYFAAGKWDKCIALLPFLQSEMILTQTEYQAAAETIYCHWLEKNLNIYANEAWNKIPKTLQKKNSLLKVYIAYLIQQNQADLAEKELYEILNKHYDAELILCYAGIKYRDTNKQIHQLDKWLNKYGEKAEIYLALGEVYLRNKIWGKAAFNLEKSLALEKTKRVYLNLAKLSDATNKPDKVNYYYRMAAMV